MMELDELRAIVVRWAGVVPKVRAVLLFGSHARGEAKPESDVDLAVELDADGSYGLATWICDSDEWRDALASRLPTVDLQLSSPHDDIVRPAVQREGILLYRRPGGA